MRLVRNFLLTLALVAGACGEDKGESTNATETSGGVSTTTTAPTTGAAGSSTTGADETTDSSGDGTDGGTGSGTTGDTTGDATGDTGEPGDPAIEKRCLDMNEASANGAAENCECLVTAGVYPDQESCLAASMPPEGYAGCLCAIYARYPESNAYFDCGVPIQASYVECLAASECKMEELDACLDAFVAAIMECQPPRGVAEEAMMNCEMP